MKETLRGVSSSGLEKPKEVAVGSFDSARSGSSVTCISLNFVTSPSFDAPSLESCAPAMPKGADAAATASVAAIA